MLSLDIPDIIEENPVNFLKINWRIMKITNQMT